MGYTSIIDTDADAIADDTVIRIDAHTEKDGSRFPEYKPPQITAESLQTIAVELRSIAASDVASLVETKAEQLRNDANTHLLIEAKNLTKIAIFLSVLITKKQYQNEIASVGRITEFGKAITWGNERLLARSMKYKSIPKLKPKSDKKFHINPFETISGKQRLVFVTNQGVPIECTE